MSGPKRMMALTIVVVLAAGCGSTPGTAMMMASSAGDVIVQPVARGASQPVPVNKVNDAAIWVHPDDPALSMLLVSNERHGVEVHDADGALLKVYGDGEYSANNVDVLYGRAGHDDEADYVVASCVTAAGAAGVKVFRVEPAKQRLADVTGAQLIKVFDGAPPAGLCTYHSRRTGKMYFFVTSKSGDVGQYELAADEQGRFSAKTVRTLHLASKVKYCVADDEQEVAYFSEEQAGIWKFDAEPGGSVDGALVARVGEHGLEKDVVGVAIYGAGGGQGYLLAVTQGEKGTYGHSAIKVYERAAPHAFVLTVDPSASGPGGALQRMSGVAVTNRPTGRAFPRGLLMANDRVTPNASEDFKLFAWEDVAGPGRLRTDTAWSPRGAGKAR